MLDSVGNRWTVLVIVGAVSIGVVASGVWLLADGQVPPTGQSDGFDSCGTITDSGRYELTSDITDSNAATCVEIRSSDVVVTGGGHRIDGVGSFGSTGIVVRSPSEQPLANVTIRNIRVSEWDDGIRYIRVDNSRIVGTRTEHNRVGVSLLDTHHTRVADSVAHENRLRGISVLESSTNNTLVNNTATNNSLYGFHLVEGGVQNNTLNANVAMHNEFGFVLIGVQNNTIIGNTASGNRIAGIWLSASSRNHLDGNRVSDRFYGILLADQSNGNRVANTTAEANQVGIRLRSSDRNHITDNTIRGSPDNAILLISSDDTVIADNAGTNNARGITVIRSTGTARTNNTGL